MEKNRSGLDPTRAPKAFPVQGGNICVGVDVESSHGQADSINLPCVLDRNHIHHSSGFMAGDHLCVARKNWPI